jgi:hypothetical protein
MGRNWSLMNRLNQKGTRPQDAPVELKALPAEDKAFIALRYPELFEERLGPEGFPNRQEDPDHMIGRTQGEPSFLAYSVSISSACKASRNLVSRKKG